MSDTTRLQCRCGQQFTAWLINGAPRSRCPFCKAPVSEATEVVLETVSPAATPLPTGSPLPAVSAPAAVPRRPSVAVPLDGWHCAVLGGLAAAALAGGVGWWLVSPTVSLIASATGLLGVAPLAFWLAPKVSRRVPLAQWAQPCPQCQGTNCIRLNYTWWGGYLGTRLTRQVCCTDCGRRFNGRTGEPDHYAIVTVLAARVACLLIVLTILLALVMLNRPQDG